MLLAACRQGVKSRLRSDVQVALMLATAAADASLHTAQENLKVQPNQQLKDAIRPRVQQVSANVEELRVLCYTPPPDRTKKKILAGIAWESADERRMEIKVFNNNVEKALKVAKKKLAGEGLFRELKRRRYYEKPSVRKKAKQREAQRRRQKWLSKRRPE
jgi:small subunit ribosomal protein S21